MTSLKAGVGAIFVSAGCFALSSSYHVHSGDTLGSIAHKFHVPVHSLAVANGLDGHSVLRLGMKLTIPGESSSSNRHSSSSNQGGYTVKEGQNDWIIAHKFGLTVPQLHRLNPGVNWNALHPGIHLSVSGGSRSTHSSSHSDSHPSSHSSQKSTPQHDRTVGDHTYTVKDGDNDWIIAKKLNITHSALMDLNPDVRWSRLQTGEKINAPGGRVTLNYTRGYAENVTIAADNVTLRRKPSTSSEKVTEVNAGTLAKVVGRHGNWYQLKFPKGTVAWVRNDYLVASHSAPRTEYAKRRESTARYAYHRSKHESIHGSYNYALHVPAGMASNKLLKTAYAMRGTRYVWGGTSRSGGFDCSGFTSTVYRKDGIDLPRTSREQSQIGTQVHRGNLQKGDLVFFKTLGSHHINHVGIYIGNGKFMHASSGRGRVTVSSLSDSYYSNHFAEARRVIKHKSSTKKKSSHKK